MKLNTRYTILISTFGVIFIIPLFFFFNRHINSTIEKESVITLEKNLNLISSSIEELLKNEIEMTLFLSDRPALKDLLKKNNSEFIQLSEVERRNELTRKNEVWITSNSENELVKEILDSQTSSLLKSVSSSFHNRYGEIFITNKFGAVVGSTSKLTTYLHNYKKWWVNAYNEDRGRIFIDDRGFDESAGSYVLGIVAPMFDKEELIGIIKCNVNIQGLLQKIKKYEESIGNNWSLIVSRQNGSIIYKRETEPLTEQLSESLMVKTEKQIIYKNWIIQDEELILNMTLPINSTFSNSVYDFGGTQESIDHKFGNTGENWNLTAFISKKDLLSNNAESRKKLILLGFLFTISSSLFAWVLSTQMTKNIKRILPVIEAIGNGKLEMRIDPPSSNEIRLISETVNRMAENLQKTLISKDKLQILFNEKEQLLTEVNHRVKNNLQLITSLIGLKESHSDVKELSDIKHHVEAISLTHEMLQNSDEEYEIDIRYYLNVILENVFALTEGKISINKNMEIEKLKIEKAKILGLIINETATNTIKYSSYKEKQITYNFSLSKNENRGIVRISDNGNPIPDNIEMTNSRTLGLQLISMLVKQLKGEIKLTKKPFPEFYIEFPLD